MSFERFCEKFIGKYALAVSWKAAAITFFLFVISLYMVFTLVNDHFVHHLSWYEQSAPCVTPQFIMDQMINLTFSTSSLLTKLGIPHVICYGTLWGALRDGKILPWDNNVDFCVLKKDIEQVPLATLQVHFKSKDMDLSYDLRHGEYIITQGAAAAFLTVFYVTPFDEVFLDGFEHRFLWFFQDKPMSFPIRLIEPPFKTILFHDRPIPVPHDGIEILKYLYRDDWWMEKPPLGCKV